MAFGRRAADARDRAALASEPGLILVDEATLGLAPMMAEEIFRCLKRINQERGISVLIVEQNASLALANASFAYVLEAGRIVLEGPADVLAQGQDHRSRGRLVPECWSDP